VRDCLLLNDQHSARCHVYEMYAIARTAMYALKRLAVIGRLEPMVNAQTGLRASVENGIHRF
jgi:hypothetical protein